MVDPVTTGAERTFSALLVIVPLVIQAAIGVAVWMWKRSMVVALKNSALHDHIAGGPSIRIQLEALDTASKFQSDEIDRLHRVASDMNSELIKKFGDLDVTLRQRMEMLAERDLRELRGRVDRIEQGQSEWIRTLRGRTHSLGNAINNVLLRVTLMERGVKTKPTESSTTFTFNDAGDEGDKS